MSYMMTSASPKCHLLSESGLRLGRLNVYHLFNKVPDISSFLNNEHPCIHLLCLSETRLDYRMSDESIAVPQYLTFRRDAIKKKVKQASPYIFTLPSKVSPLRVLTWNRNMLKASGLKLAIRNHRPC